MISLDHTENCQHMWSKLLQTNDDTIKRSLLFYHIQLATMQLLSCAFIVLAGTMLGWHECYRRTLKRKGVTQLFRINLRCQKIPYCSLVHVFFQPEMWTMSCEKCLFVLMLCNSFIPPSISDQNIKRFYQCVIDLIISMRNCMYFH